MKTWQSIIHPATRWAALAVTALLMACSKNLNPLPKPIDAVEKTVQKIASSTTDFVIYEYNSNQQVTKQHMQRQQQPGNITLLTRLYFYNNGRLTKWTAETGEARYEYSGNKVVKMETFAINGRKISTLGFSYTNNILTEVTELSGNPMPGNAVATRLQYHYYPGGNLQKIDYALKTVGDGPYEVYQSALYDRYDDKKNPEPDNILSFYVPGITLHKNNPLIIKTLDGNGRMVFTTRNTYEYNPHGYPVTRKQYLSDSNANGVEFTYDY